MRTTVYINTTRDKSFGFANDYSPARLRVGGRFEYDTSFDKDLQASAEVIFEQLNVGGELVEATEWTKQWRADGEPSLSVGDVVMFRIAQGVEKAYAVGRWGWDEVDPKDVGKAFTANWYPCPTCAATNPSAGVLQCATYVADRHVELECGHSVAKPAK